MWCFCLGALAIILGIGIAAWRRSPGLALILLGAALAGIGAAGDLAAQKAIGRLLMPLGLIWCACLAATAWQAGRGRRLPAAAAAAMAAAIALAANPILGAALLRGLEARVPPPSPGPPYDAVLVLGGGTRTAEDGAPGLGDSGDRLATAATLWHAGRARILVGSGIAGVAVDEPDNLAEQSRRIWTGWGIPDAAIRCIPPAGSATGPMITRDEIIAFAARCRAEGWSRVAVISSGWHLPRALAQARRLDFACDAIPAERQGAVPSWHPLHLIPYAPAAAEIHRACWEHIGRWVGR